MKHIVDISDMKIADRVDDEIVTYSLGSCIGMSLFDPVQCLGGMIHFMLPLSKIDRIKAKVKPCMFADTGIPLLLQAMFDCGATKSNLIVKVAGGAAVLDDNGRFKIGERNYAVMRKILWKNNILIDGEDVAGNKSRTMILNMSSGVTSIKSGQTVTEI